MVFVFEKVNVDLVYGAGLVLGLISIVIVLLIVAVLVICSPQNGFILGRGRG